MLWYGPGSAGRVGAGDDVDVELTAGFRAEVGLEVTLGVGDLVETNFDEGGTGEQADNKNASRVKIPGKPGRGILKPGINNFVPKQSLCL